MNGETMLIFTTKEGGYFQTVLDSAGKIWRYSEEEYEELKKSRKLNITPNLDYETWVWPARIALARIEDNHDFILESSREAAAASVSS